MASKSKATQATFTGVVNGRPRFDWGDQLPPPAWLLKLADSGKVKDGEFIVGASALGVGQVVTGADHNG